MEETASSIPPEIETENKQEEPEIESGDKESIHNDTMTKYNEELAEDTEDNPEETEAKTDANTNKKTTASEAQLSEDGPGEVEEPENVSKEASEETPEEINENVQNEDELEPSDAEPTE